MPRRRKILEHYFDEEDQHHHSNVKLLYQWHYYEVHDYAITGVKLISVQYTADFLMLLD